MCQFRILIQQLDSNLSLRIHSSHTDLLKGRVVPHEGLNELWVIQHRLHDSILDPIQSLRHLQTPFRTSFNMKAHTGFDCGVDGGTGGGAAGAALG